MSLIYLAVGFLVLMLGTISKDDKSKMMLFMFSIALSLLVIGFVVIDFYETWLRMLHLFLNPSPTPPPGMALG